MAGWSKSHELSRCVVRFTAIGCVLCTYCCICMIAVGERCFDCCKSCNLVDSSICQFPPMVCMISSIACDIQFRGICVQAPVGLQPFFLLTCHGQCLLESSDPGYASVDAARLSSYCYSNVNCHASLYSVILLPGCSVFTWI